MTELAASVTPVSAQPRPPSEAAEPAPLWHLGWLVGVASAGAALQAGLGAINWPTLIALGVAAVPGLVGYLWRPSGRERLTLLAVWGLAMAVAARFEGGLTGPLGLWCAMPLLVGVLIGATAEGSVISAATLLVTVLIELSGMATPAPAGLFGLGVSAVGLVTIGGAAVGVLAIMAGRARERAQAQAQEHGWLNGVMSELPQLALALDREGRAEAVFGAPLAGLDIEALRVGLVEAAVEADQPHLRAAICEAMDHGQGETRFRPAAAPGRWLSASFRRRSEDGLTALVRETDAAAEPAVEPVVEPVGEPAGEVERLRAELQAREAAEAAALARITALDGKLKGMRRARALAFAALSEATAARDRAEVARADAEANALGKARFLANMSHELRTPLNAIMGFSDIMRHRMFGELPVRYGEYADLIHESGRHLLDLINDVLDMSKIEAERYTLSLETFDAREAVNAALRLVRLQADEAGVALRGLAPAEPLAVTADKRALKQIVLNLVSNALKFTPSGGSITVTTQAVDGAFELVVADTGVGIAKADLERLGRPFEQVGDVEHKAQGTGLGLSLVKALARLHGGEMQIESELGEGAAVTVRLPVLLKPEPVEATPAVEASAPAEVAGTPAPPPPPEQPRMGEVIPLNLLR